MPLHDYHRFLFFRTQLRSASSPPCVYVTFSGMLYSYILQMLSFYEHTRRHMHKDGNIYSQSSGQFKPRVLVIVVF